MKKVNLKALTAAMLLGMAISTTAVAKRQIQDMPMLHGMLQSMNSKCQLSVSTTQIDYGEQSRWQLQDTRRGKGVTPGQRTLTLTAICPFSQTMRLAVRGDKSTGGELRYGNNGWILLRMTEAQLDGNPVQLSATTPYGRKTGSEKTHGALKPGDYVVATRGGQPVRGKIFTARLEVTPVIPEVAARVASRQRSEAVLLLELLK